MPHRYVVISADCHAGATIETYREYLDPGFQDEYDDWRKGFQNPFPDLVDTTSRDYLRNFDNAVRQEDLEGDGVVAEVIFPNTIPPFFAGMMLFNGPDPTSRRELEQRWAGLHAHNRWLADFCAELPGRRAGVAQVLLDDVERAVEEVRWIREQPGLFGGVLVPNPNADSRVAPLHAPGYEALWAAIEASGLPMNVHGGPGGPNLGAYPATPMMMFLEFGWYAQRPLVRLIFGGVLERHPRLTLVFTETGNRWVPGALKELDTYYDMVATAPSGSVEATFGAFARENLKMRPSDYWARQCYLGASSMSRKDLPAAEKAGLDHVMWGGDYPHTEGTHPHTAESLRHTFSGVPHDEVQLLLGANAARVYKFDLDELSKIAARVGPFVSDVDRPLARDEMPEGALTMALRGTPS
ncbi:MAG: amidohydrolase family protein [Acidimicrobiales bacterium]